MLKIQKILFATDFSHGAAWTGVYARTIARATGAVLHILFADVLHSDASGAATTWKGELARTQMQSEARNVREREDEDEIFVVVEEMPTIIGGLKRLYEVIEYPDIARRAVMEGMVVIYFVVSPQGKPLELENGIGPITSASLDEIDQALVDRGAELFKTKCSACHKMDTRYVGPPLDGILDRRTPAYVMNTMLNPEEMLQRHPDAKAMLAEYMTQMPDQQLSEDDARAVVKPCLSCWG